MAVEITKELIECVAENARLKLSNEESEQFAVELKEVLDAFSKLDEVDTEGVPPSLQPVELKNRTRKDVKGNCLSQEEALSLSKHTKDGYFKGPKVV